MKLIPLSQGYSAMVDDEDFERVNQFKWCVKRRKHSPTIHAVRTVNFKKDGRRTSKNVWMHHFIAGVTSHVVDHFDGNGLNNQKSNLRHATFAQNSSNRAVQSRNASGFKGVLKR